MNYQAFVLLLGMGGLCLFAGLYGAVIFPQSSVFPLTAFGGDIHISTSYYVADVFYGNTCPIKANLDKDGMGPPEPITNAFVQLVDNGVVADSDTTDQNGWVTLHWAISSYGSHSLRVSWSGNSTYPNGGWVEFSTTVAETPPPPPPTYTPMVLAGLGIILFALWRRKTL